MSVCTSERPACGPALPESRGRGVCLRASECARSPTRRRCRRRQPSPGWRSGRRWQHWVQRSAPAGFMALKGASERHRPSTCWCVAQVRIGGLCSVPASAIAPPCTCKCVKGTEQQGREQSHERATAADSRPVALTSPAAPHRRLPHCPAAQRLCPVRPRELQAAGRRLLASLAPRTARCAASGAASSLSAPITAPQRRQEPRGEQLRGGSRQATVVRSSLLPPAAHLQAAPATASRCHDRCAAPAPAPEPTRRRAACRRSPPDGTLPPPAAPPLQPRCRPRRRPAA